MADAAHSAAKEEVGARGEKTIDVIHKQLLWLTFRKALIGSEESCAEAFLSVIYSFAKQNHHG